MYDNDIDCVMGRRGHLESDRYNWKIIELALNNNRSLTYSSIVDQPEYIFFRVIQANEFDGFWISFNSTSSK